MAFEVWSQSGRRFLVRTLAEEPDLRRRLDEVAALGWPPFMGANAESEARWARVLDLWPRHQFAIIGADDGAVVAAGHAVPCEWDGSEGGLPGGWDDVVRQGISLAERDGPELTTASALSVVSDPAHRSRGLAAVAVEAMRRVASSAGHKALLAPVRPNLKHLYPLIPMDRYMVWMDAKGRCFDPWLRTHMQAGAHVLGVAPESMTIVAGVSEWEQWTGSPMPGSGRYIVPEALVPIEVDENTRYGTYVEPNVWMLHQLPEADMEAAPLTGRPQSCPPS